MEPITSRSNQKIKLARSLRKRKTRQELGLFLVEGIRHVAEAYESGARIEFILFSHELLQSDFALNLIETISSSEIPCFPTSPTVFRTIAEKEHPQGLIAVMHRPETSLDRLSSHNFPWGIAIVSPQDPGNIGTILRSIDAVGASGLILLDSSVDPFHPNSVRASMGTIFWYSIATASFGEFSEWANQNLYSVYGTSAHADIDYRDSGLFDLPCILLMGGEREGLNPEHKSACKQILKIPMRGRTTSLNLGVSAGIFLYQMRDKLSPGIQ